MGSKIEIVLRKDFISLYRWEVIFYRAKISYWRMNGGEEDDERKRILLGINPTEWEVGLEQPRNSATM